MMDQLLRQRLIDAYMMSIPLITLNVIWFVVSIPLITLIPATGALFYATNQLAHGRNAGWQTFFEGFRLYFWQSWLWGLINLLIIGVALSNLVFYSRSSGELVGAARVIVILLSTFWFALQIYTFPLLMEQVKPHLRVALRNSGVLVFKRPLTTAAVMLAIALLAVGTTFLLQPAWIMITASLCAYLASYATVSGIAALKRQQQDSSKHPEQN